MILCDDSHARRRLRDCVNFVADAMRRRPFDTLVASQILRVHIFGARIIAFRDLFSGVCV